MTKARKIIKTPKLKENYEMILINKAMKKGGLIKKYKNKIIIIILGKDRILRARCGGSPTFH